MTLVTVTTNKSNHEIERVVQRHLGSDELILEKGIPIKSYSHPNPCRDSVTFKLIPELTFPFTLTSSLAADHLWHVARLFLNHDAPRPNLMKFIDWYIK